MINSLVNNVAIFGYAAPGMLWRTPRGIIHRDREFQLQSGVQDSTVACVFSQQPVSWSADLLEIEQGMGRLVVKASGLHGFQHVRGLKCGPDVYKG